jgi:hypothetical protein
VSSGGFFDPGEEKGAEIDMLNDKREEFNNKTTCPSD